MTRASPKGRISLSARRLSLRKVKEVLRVKFVVGLGLRQIARSCSIGPGTVHEYLQRAKAAAVLVQREMESGRSVRSITPIPRAVRTDGSGCGAAEGTAAETATGFKKKEFSLAGLIHSVERSPAESQLATKRILNIHAAMPLNKAAVPAASRRRDPAAGG